MAAGETAGLGVNDGVSVAVGPPMPAGDDGRRTAKPATATTMIAATASNGLKYVFTWESLQETRHAGCWG